MSPHPTLPFGRILAAFGIADPAETPSPFGSGHIHDTFRVAAAAGGEYLLQRINDGVFRDVDALMSNLSRVTAHLRARRRAEPGGDPDREALTLVPAADGRPYFRDPDSGCWRVFRFIGGTLSYDTTADPGVMREAGRAFGGFLVDLADLPGPRLAETIPRFHDLSLRLDRLRRSVREDPAGRAGRVRPEIDWVLARSESMLEIQRLAAAGRIPERVTHNDTKINNVLFAPDGKALCVVDLDTVMPGLVHYDFGDALRTGANPAPEDERDLSRVRLDLDLFEAFTRGYLAGAGPLLAESERETLAAAPALMTYLIGVRFLTDHVEGDVYYKVRRPGHNLDRARTQFRLVEEMEHAARILRAVVRDALVLPGGERAARGSARL